MIKARRLRLSEIDTSGRFRTEDGDIAALAESMSRALLHPVVVDEKHRLIAGWRRIQAAKLLKWESVPVTVVASLDDALSKLRAQRDENTCRKNFTPEEAVNLAEALEPLERKEAQARQAAGQKAGGGDRRSAKAKSLERKKRSSGPKRSADRVAAAVGMSAKTLKKAKAVRDAATKDPKRHGAARDAMNKSGKVDSAYKAVRRAEDEAARTAAAAAVAGLDLTEVCDIRHCSMDKLFASGVRPDCVITDPPYPKEFIGLYGQLAELTKDVPLVAVMCGQSYLPEILASMVRHLRYRWTLAYLTPGGQAVQVWHAEVNTSWKPVLLFGKASGWIGDVARSAVNDNDKRFHDWGQSESGMADLVERLSSPGQLVCDPFVGGGTTAVVSLKLGRRFVGCDTDAAAVETSRRRCRER